MTSSNTLGQLIHTYRKKCGKSIADIKEETNISEKVLRRLESDLTNHPKLETIERVAKSLVIPYTEIAERVVPIQRNQECVREILIRVLPEASKKLLTNVVHQYVTLGHSIREGLIEVLNIAKTAKNVDNAEKLYSVLGKHAMNYQENDIMASAMFEEYLIARDKDLSNSYYLGKRLIEVAHFLPDENRVVAYYKVGVHARIIKKHHESNEYLKNIIDNPRSKNKLFQEKAYHAYYNNLITLEKLDEAELYLEEYAKIFNRYDSAYYKIDKAIIYARRNQIVLAISLLEKYLEDYENHHNTIFVICELMQLYIKSNKIYVAREMYRFEGVFDKILESNNLKGPFNQLYYGLYLRIKGRVEFLSGKVKEAVKFLLESMQTFADLGHRQEFLESMKLLYDLNRSQIVGIQAPRKSIMDTNVQLRISELLHVITNKEEKGYMR
ncbi:helix-turn-helix domain-containing protein [Brevibacillus laterosporus]|uniref:Helix-turn-helix transcriptional regulator n=1 Tax=Brevibacillus laterosporus TaxID=1465 RepID=A0AAP3G6R8_BRELA|nr:helix-turn-helix transcriptional regulator [Brevibacillus laterosporus]MCR8979518.1 helix-turn-helix domain-containing protein [Brevibacillus laterosporus]MCZ0806673.1 helix-turn-helix transcriptional regulator [Brevibacillus laterosporus]MCZ0825121.1 helix-turn-helix transcriptional regulator [Brevibacillus laterosporus]MCZ0852041.1 helix-turn-helix transcriptional regulator [Brevibacillus laterosporus]